MSDYSNIIIAGLLVGGLVLYMKSQEKKTQVSVEVARDNAQNVRVNKQPNMVQQPSNVITSESGSKKRGYSTKVAI